MSQDINTLFNKTKGQLFFKKTAGFLGRLLAQVEFQWTTELPTAAISNTTLYWNPEFYMSRTAEQRVTILAHELWHNGLLHGARLGSRDPETWNEAADHVINLRLQKDGYDMSGFPYLMDRRFTDMSTEDVYDILWKEKQGKPQPKPNDMAGDVLPVSKDEINDAVGKTVSAITAARIGGMEAGSLPGELESVIDHFLNPKLPWEVLLFNFFNELTTQEYSYSRPNRRYQDPLLPGQTGRNGLEHLIHYQDISGSITDDNILRFNSELKFIKDEFNPQKMTVVTFDTKIRDIYVFEEDDEFNEIKIVGRGGTDLKDVFKHMQKEAPNAAVIFTDLEVAIPKDPGIPIIWVCTDNPRATVPYGRLIHVSD